MLKPQRSAVVQAIAFRLSVPSVQLFVLNGALAAGALIISVLLARALVPADRGTLANLTLWATMSANISMAGLHLYLARSVAYEPSLSKAIYRTSLGLLMGLSGLTCGFYALVITGALGLSTGPLLLVCGMAIVPFAMWNALQVQIELGAHRLDTYILARASFTVVHLLLVAVLFMAGLRDVLTLLLAFLLAAILAAIVTGRVIHLVLEPGRGATLTERPLDILVRAARRDGLSVVLVALSTMADRILVSLFFDTATFGIYIVALALAQIQSIVSESMAPLFFSRLARDWAAIRATPSWLMRRLRQTILINILVSGSVIVTAPVLLPLLYGETYRDALDLVILLVVAFALRGMMRPFEEVLKGSNEALRQSVSIALMTCVFAVVAVPAALIGEIQLIVAGLILASLAGLASVAIATSSLLGCSLGQLVVPQFTDALDLTSMILQLARSQGRRP